MRYTPENGNAEEFLNMNLAEFPSRLPDVKPNEFEPLYVKFHDITKEEREPFITELRAKYGPESVQLHL